MKPKNLYFALCILGVVIPYAAFVPWLLEHGLNVRLFAQDLLANRISLFFVLDVVISAIVLVVFIGRERRSGIRGIWTVLPALLLVGVSLAFPLFLLLRENRLESGNRAARPAASS